MKSFEAFKKELLKDPKMLREYRKQELEFTVAATLIQKRIERRLTQDALAKKMGVHQATIARMESGSCNPTIKQLEKVARALNSRLVISMK